MKFRVTMKTPDGLITAITEAVQDDARPAGLSDEEIALFWEDRTREIDELCRRWFSCGEYLTVEVDTEAKTCTVVAN